jgi:hypothetical protein
MSNTYTKNLNDIYFLNDKNIVSEIDADNIINPIASHEIVKNISNDVSAFIDLTNANTDVLSAAADNLAAADTEIIEKINSDIATLDEKLLNTIDETSSTVTETLTELIGITAHNLSTYSDNELQKISNDIALSVDKNAKDVAFLSDEINIKSEELSTYINLKVSTAYKVMGSVSTFEDLEAKLLEYVENETANDCIGQVWNVINATEAYPEASGKNFVFVKADNGGFTWDDIGGIVDLTNYVKKELLSETANAIRTELHTSADTLNTSISETANAIRAELHTSADTLSTSISNTANAIRSELHTSADTLSTSIIDLATNINEFTHSTFVHLSGGDLISGAISISTDITADNVNASTLHIGSAKTNKENVVVLGKNTTANNDSQFVWNGKNDTEFIPNTDGGTFNINPRYGINGIFIGSEKLTSIISTDIKLSADSILETVNLVSTDIENQINETNTKLNTVSSVVITNVADIKYLSDEIITTNTNVNTISTDVKIALHNTIKNISLLGHITIDKTVHSEMLKTVYDVITAFNLAEDMRIVNGAMYHVVFNNIDELTDPHTLSAQFIEVTTSDDKTIRLAHDDYIIFHNHDAVKFLAANEIKAENILIKDIAFTDFYNLSAMVFDSYAHLSGNTDEHAFSGRHEFKNGEIITDTLIANISVETEDLSTNTLTANTSISSNTLTADTSINTNELTATNSISTNMLTASTSVETPVLSANTITATTSVETEDLNTNTLTANTSISTNMLTANTLTASTSAEIPALSANTIIASTSVSAVAISAETQIYAKNTETAFREVIGESDYD